MSYEEQRSRNVKNHGTSLKKLGKGRKKMNGLKLITTKKVLGIIMREDVIAGVTEEGEMLDPE